MAASTDQFAEDYKDVQAKFARSPYIKILSTDGDPPKSYEIEYRVKGLTQDAGGQILPMESHRVEINLPFGYPHFPPNCKPLTPVFHPDFDPDAIRIGDFWESSPCLADLIIHIGQLVCYEKYSTEDVFNTEALEWATNNSDKLPLEEIDFSVQEEEPLELDLEETPEEQDKTDQKPETPAQEIKTKATSSNLPKIIGGGVVLVAVIISLLLFLDVNSYNKASQLWEQITTLVDQNEFTEADRQLKEARKKLNSIKFLKKNEKQALLQQINDLSSSEKYLQGLEGKILVKGKYLSIQEQAEIQVLLELLAEGEKRSLSSRWQQAAGAFEKALAKALELNDSSPMPANDVKELLTRSLIKLQIETGNSLRKQGRWTQAISSYEIAIEQLKDMRAGQKSAKGKPQVWTMDSFKKSFDLLAQARSNRGVLGITKADIDKNILSASIEREDYKATTSLQKEDYSQAVASLQQIVSLIDKSPYAGSKQFAAKRESAITRIQENKFYQIIQEKTLYLYANYQQIFKAKFASANESALSDPIVEFFKQAGNGLIFKMQCKETVRRQKYTLEMYYQYDISSKTWSVYQ